MFSKRVEESHRCLVYNSWITYGTASLLLCLIDGNWLNVVWPDGMKIWDRSLHHRRTPYSSVRPSFYYVEILVSDSHIFVTTQFRIIFSKIDQVQILWVPNSGLILNRIFHWRIKQMISMSNTRLYNFCIGSGHTWFPNLVTDIARRARKAPNKTQKNEMVPVVLLCFDALDLGMDGYHGT